MTTYVHLPIHNVHGYFLLFIHSLLTVVQVECLLEVQENVLEKFRQGIMAVSKKKILVKSEEDSDAEEKGRMWMPPGRAPVTGINRGCLQKARIL